MTDEEIAAVNGIVNNKIRENIPVVIKEMNKDKAMKLGAMALFGEKYGDMVRVVTIDPNYSVELCGGTHVASTGELGHVIIVSESGVAAGVRRIEAVCGMAADQKEKIDQNLLKEVQAALKNPKDIIKALEQQSEELSSMKKLLEQTENKLLAYLQKDLLNKAEQIRGVNFIGEIVDVSSSDLLKKLCNDLRNGFSNTVVVLGAVNAGKPSLSIGLSDNLSIEKELDAVVMIKTIVAPAIKGGGGGQKNLATAGGQEPTGLAIAIQAIKKVLS
jgi:alanyl-tRNA synthetase